MRAMVITFILLLVGCDTVPLSEQGVFTIALYGFNDKEYLTIWTAAKIWEEKTKGAIKIDIVKPGKEEFRFIKDETGNNAGLTVPACKTIIIGLVNTYVVGHEIGHMMGLGHEHQRVDRDSYITVDLAYIIKWYGLLIALQFVPNNDDFIDMRYDYLSIMHYGEGNVTTWLIDSRGHVVGGSVPTELDAEKIIRKYGRSKDVEE